MKRLLGLMLMLGVAGCDAGTASNTRPKNEPEPAGEKSGVVKLGSLSSRTPATWKEEKASSTMRMYQFQLPKADGDKEGAELVVFFFGQGGGGGVDENINRWKGFFQAPEGKTADEMSKVEKFKVGDVKVTYLDVTGTFLSKNPPFDPNAKTEKKTNFRRFGVIFDSADGPYFITVTGPARTLEQNKKTFDEWLKNFK